MKELFNKEYIQDMARELWQDMSNSGRLAELPDALSAQLSDHLACIIGLEEEDSFSPAYASIDMLADKIVLECLDLDELNQEAADNTDYIRAREDAVRGQY